MNKDPMMEKTLDALALGAFGRSRQKALTSNSCVKCGGPALEFKDELSRREYNISMMCQKCQDDFFGEFPEPEPEE
jgi:uncharacterized CHY-type Zn-finger protein